MAAKNKRTKVRVWVGANISISIPYVVEVKNVNPEEIRQKLLEKSLTDWESTPDLYKIFDWSWKAIIREMTDEKIKQNTVHLG